MKVALLMILSSGFTFNLSGMQFDDSDDSCGKHAEDRDTKPAKRQTSDFLFLHFGN